MTGGDVLALYGQLAATVARMLELARALQWAPLPALDARCTELFVQLRDAPEAAAFSAAERAQLAALTETIERDQQAVQGLLRPHLEHLVRRMYESHGGR